MEFFKCSIAGVSYGTGVTEIERVAAARKSQVQHPVACDDQPIASSCTSMQHGSGKGNRAIRPRSPMSCVVSHHLSLAKRKGRQRMSL